ncbi:hypothetical protein LTR29_002206 [Friedmanniomyces endolithicus]|nr:hypothetical protein LTR29_002206 [Friedmanniomyces endolithicus]
MSIFRDGLWSGLVGTLQKYGYTEINRTSIGAAFEDAVSILINKQGSAEDSPAIKRKEIGVMVFLGLNHMITTFGVKPENGPVCNQVAEQFAAMKLATIGHTLGLEHPHEKDPQIEANEAWEKTFKAIEAAEGVYAQYGSPFGGTGEHIPGHKFTTFGVNPWKYSIFQQLIDDFAAMEMATSGETLGLTQDVGDAEEVDEDFQKVCKEIKAAECVCTVRIAVRVMDVRKLQLPGSSLIYINSDG